MCPLSWVECRRVWLLSSLLLLSLLVVIVSARASATSAHHALADRTSCPVTRSTISENAEGKKVFVYELPSHLGPDVLLAGDPSCSRLQGGHGSWQWMYSTEFAVYQALLQLPLFPRRSDGQSSFLPPERQQEKQQQQHHHHHHHHHHHQLLRTLEPTEADLFFIPGFAACHLHSNTSAAPTMDFVATAEYLAECVGHVRAAYPFFNMSGGADHFMVLSHDIGRCLLGHRRRQFGETFFITHTGDASTTHGSHYAAYVDLYSASASQTLSDRGKLLLQEFRDGVLSGGPCFRRGVDVVVPPATGVSLMPELSGTCTPNVSVAAPALLLLSPPAYRRLVVDGGAISFPAPPNEGFSRRKLAVFRGSVYDASSPHSFGTRQLLLERFRAQTASGNWSQMSVVPTTTTATAAAATTTAAATMTTTTTTTTSSASGTHGDNAYRRTYFLELLNAKFCLCLPGFAPWTVRLIEAVLFGCIPVLLNDPANYLPFSDGSLMNLIDWQRDVVLTITFDDLAHGDLQDLLMKIPPADVARRQQNMLRVRHLLTYPPREATAHSHRSAKNAVRNGNAPHTSEVGEPWTPGDGHNLLGQPQNAIDAVLALLVDKALNVSRRRSKSQHTPDDCLTE